MAITTWGTGEEWGPGMLLNSLQCAGCPAPNGSSRGRESQFAHHPSTGLMSPPRGLRAALWPWGRYTWGFCALCLRPLSHPLSDTPLTWFECLLSAPRPAPLHRSPPNAQRCHPFPLVAYLFCSLCPRTHHHPRARGPHLPLGHGASSVPRTPPTVRRCSKRTCWMADVSSQNWAPGLAPKPLS